MAGQSDSPNALLSRGSLMVIVKSERTSRSLPNLLGSKHSSWRIGRASLRANGSTYHHKPPESRILQESFRPMYPALQGYAVPELPGSVNRGPRTSIQASSFLPEMVLPRG